MMGLDPEDELMARCAWCGVQLDRGEYGICLKCMPHEDDFDADELGLDPEEEYDA